MNGTYTPDGDMIWFGNSVFQVNDVLYRMCSPSQVGKVIATRFVHVPHLDTYAPAGKKCVEQYVTIRWLKPATRKRFGAESESASRYMSSLTNLMESHERKAKQLRKDLEAASNL